jgi:rRNA maturation endonuclease Nob1
LRRTRWRNKSRARSQAQQADDKVDRPQLSAADIKTLQAAMSEKAKSD